MTLDGLPLQPRWASVDNSIVDWKHLPPLSGEHLPAASLDGSAGLRYPIHFNYPRGAVPWLSGDYCGDLFEEPILSLLCLLYFSRGPHRSARPD